MAILSEYFRRTEAMASIIEGFVQGVDEIEIAQKFNTLEFQIKYYVNAIL